jgi:hypothetical protein
MSFIGSLLLLGEEQVIWGIFLSFELSELDCLRIAALSIMESLSFLNSMSRFSHPSNFSLQAHFVASQFSWC